MKKILFVCVENACRSQMAEAFARRMGKGKVKVFSAGSRPSGKVNRKAIKSMESLGYNLNQHHSKSLDDVPGEDYDCVITMGCGDKCPQIPAKHREDWDIKDPKGLPEAQFNHIRDNIGSRVKKLIKQQL